MGRGGVMSNTKDIRGSHGLISTALHDDKVLLPGKPVGPDSLLLKRMNVDINYLMFELESIQLEYIIQTNIMVAEKLREEKEELLKELDYLEEVKMKIREMQSHGDTVGGKLTQTQIEQLSALQGEVKHNIALLDKQIIQLKSKIAILANEINKLDEEISQSVKKYHSLIVDQFKIENIKEKFGDREFILLDGKLTIKSENLCELEPYVQKVLDVNPFLDANEAKSRGFDSWYEQLAKDALSSLPEADIKAAIAKDKSSDQLSELKADVITLLHSNTIDQSKENICAKRIEKVEKENSLAALQSELKGCEAAKANLTDLQQALEQVISGKKPAAKLAQQLQAQGPDIVADIMKSASRICAELGVDLDLAPEPTPPPARPGMR
jgi:chromosome segregation ATPase